MKGLKLKVVTNVADMPNHIIGTASESFTATLGGKDYTFPAGTFDVEYSGAQLTDLSRVFASKASLTSISNWTVDTSKVTNLGWMFYDSMITSINLSKFDVSNVIYMDWTFQFRKLTYLDLSNFHTKKLASVNYLFSGSKELTCIDFGDNFDMSHVPRTNGMFNAMFKLTTIKGTLKNLSVSLSLSTCPLDHDSAVRIINGLATVTTAQTLTLSDTTKATLSSTEKAILINKGWTLA